MLTTKMLNEMKANFKMNNVIWTHESNFESIKMFTGVVLNKQADFDTDKPLISILDLGKLLLKHSRDGDVARVHELIAKGAPFNADWLGMTALHYAAKRNNYEICDMLLRGGINKDAKTKVDRTPLHFAVFEGNREVVELLLARNVDVNVRDMLRMTALHWAIEKRHKSIARLLLKHGAEVMVLSKFDKTPMSIAVQTGQSDLLHDLEMARQAQKTSNNLQFDIQQNQTETNEAVNSIALGTQTSPRYDLTTNDAVNTADAEKTARKSIRVPNSPVSKYVSNTNNDVGDEDIDYVEPIVQLMDDSKQMDITALEMLKHHGITMLPNEDPKNNMLTSALEGGRKLILTEAGKLVLKETKHYKNPESQSTSGVTNVLRKISSSQFLQTGKNNNNKKPPVVVRAKGGVPLKPNKNIKIITMDMFKRMYGEEMGDSLKKASRANASAPTSQPVSKLTKVIKLNNATGKKPILQKISIKEFRNQTMHVEKFAKAESGGSDSDELPPNIIEVYSESDNDEERVPTRNSVKINSLQSSSFPASKPVLAVSPQVQPEIPILDIPEISRQLYDLRKQTDELRRQLEISQKQNEEYETRLVRLENDREDFV